MKTSPTPNLNELLGEITLLDQIKTNTRMQIASRIADAMQAKGWRNKDLLRNVGKIYPSVISKWLSGTHNFTLDTLVELELALDISLLNIGVKTDEIVIRFHAIAVQTTEPSKHFSAMEGFVSYNRSEGFYPVSVGSSRNHYTLSN